MKLRPSLFIRRTCIDSFSFCLLSHCLLLGFKHDKWYRGHEVDELSMEEAGRIANQIIEPLIEDGLLSKAEASQMFLEVEKYIQQQFMTLEDVSLLSTATYYDGWEKEIEAIGAKYIPNGKMPKIEMCRPSWFSSLFN